MVRETRAQDATLMAAPMTVMDLGETLVAAMAQEAVVVTMAREATQEEVWLTKSRTLPSNLSVTPPTRVVRAG